jgi:hypothetical protein
MKDYIQSKNMSIAEFAAVLKITYNGALNKMRTGKIWAHEVELISKALKVHPIEVYNEVIRTYLNSRK